MTDAAGGPRILELLRPLREEVRALASDASREPDEALRLLDRLEAAVRLLAQVAVDSFDEFEGRVRDLSLLRRLTDVVVSVFCPKRLPSEILTLASEELHGEAGALFLSGGDEELLELAAARGEIESGPKAGLAERLARRSLETACGFRLDDAGEDETLGELARECDWRSVLACPLAVLGQPLGAVVLAHGAPARFDEEDRRALASLADLAALALRHLRFTRERGELDLTLRSPAIPFYETRLALVQREKLAAVSKLAAIVAHEFNNPMSYVLSNLDRAREYTAQLHAFAQARGVASGRRPGEMRWLTQEMRDLLDEMAEGLARVRRVAQDLHGVGHESLEDMEQADVNALAATALQLARAEAKPGVRIEERLKPVPPVRCRRLQLMQALFHLLQNAFEAVEEEGVVRLSSYRAGDEVRIEVTDDGPGVPPERRERIFQPFYSTKANGDGLGLPISQDIVATHGGELRLEPSDEGAVFTVSLPRAPEEPDGG